jgi:hypothetical protein
MTAATTKNASELARARFAPRVSSARALAGCAFLLLMLCADVAIAQGNNSALAPKETTIDSLLTNSGTLSIVRLGEDTDMQMELRLKGKKVYAIEESMNAGFVAQFRTYSTGEVIVMSVNEGGSACPAQFQIIRVEDAGKVSVTKEFGDCGDSPAITLELIPDEQVTLRFQGYYRLSEAEEPGFKPPPPSTWVYKRGVLSELKAAPPKRRGK